ncbi:hypothetical protein QBC39DRAFT_357032 [Podospora conica]|nr:hypothetical protein QBC39DRAFT_357032 [Schizothecium conicum]
MFCRPLIFCCLFALAQSAGHPPLPPATRHPLESRAPSGLEAGSRALDRARPDPSPRNVGNQWHAIKKNVPWTTPLPCRSMACEIAVEYLAGDGGVLRYLEFQFNILSR